MKIISRVGLTVFTLTIMAALTQRFEILPYRIAFAALLVGMLSSSQQLASILIRHSRYQNAVARKSGS